MFQAILAVREEAEDVPTETREQQVANYVGPTLTDLGFMEWMGRHGGMVSYNTKLSVPLGF